MELNQKLHFVLGSQYSIFLQFPNIKCNMQFYYQWLQLQNWYVAGSLVTVLLQIFSWFWQWKHFENQLTFDEVKTYKNGPPSSIHRCSQEGEMLHILAKQLCFFALCYFCCDF